MSYEPPAPPPEPPYGSTPPPPPPPPGGYGNYGGGGYGAPPPPAPGGYNMPPSGQYDVMEAVTYGWQKFTANAGQMILASLAIVGGALLIGLIALVAIIIPARDADCRYRMDGTLDCDDFGIGAFIILGLLYVVFLIYAQVIGAGLIRESLGVTDGRPFSTAGVFKFDNIGNVIITSLLVGLGTMIGLILCVIPGIIFGFMTMFALYFVVDQRMSPVDAIKASIDLVKNNVGSTILWYVAAVVIVFVGELACFVGLLVAIPVVLVGTAFTYRRLSGRPVAP